MKVKMLVRRSSAGVDAAGHNDTLRSIMSDVVDSAIEQPVDLHHVVSAPELDGVVVIAECWDETRVERWLQSLRAEHQLAIYFVR
jgi:hypothetical protein